MRVRVVVSYVPRYRGGHAFHFVPPVTGIYHVRIDTRMEGTGEWKRDTLAWPVAIVEATTRPQLTH